jgi:WD40 repeat protein
MLKQPLNPGDLEKILPEVLSDMELTGNNPFPGLRPFSLDECHLFFGREGQADEILVKLSENRFVTVMGYSGSGKSSLMYCGLVPVLYGGFMTHTGPNWSAIISRPGTSPLNNLVDSIVDNLVTSGRISLDDKIVHKAIIGSVLRSGPDGLIEVSKYLQTQKGENIFFLIDQFEELLRFRENSNSEEFQNEAQLYVNLILTAVGQTKIPVYIALTMRSDFIGNCSVFPSLTELINHSNYLVPQMTREQKKMVIEGPIAVAGGRISQRLVKRLLSDVGNDQDQLPILQHALMRTWDYWVANREPNEIVDIRHYNAVGKIHEALSQHANEAYDELTSREKEIAEILFKNITEKSQDNKGMRRPGRLGLVAELAEAEEEDVIYVVDHFRQPGRSFLMPAANVPLNSDSFVELSHESLMRIWKRLNTWVDEEFESAQMYKRLSDAAAMYQIGKTGLWRPPDLQLALNWQKKQRPTREWGQRYDEAFERAIVFLDTSRITYEAELKNQEMMQRRVLRRTRATALILGVAFVVAILFFVLAYIQKIDADKQTLLAESRRLEAETQTKLAQQNRKVAEAQTKLAVEREQQRAQALKQVEETLEQLKIALQETGLAKKEAEDNLLLANIQRDTAQLQRSKAQSEYNRAESNLARANRLFMLVVAQSLAAKSIQEDDDATLSGLLAMQGYHYHTRYEGKKYDPYIYGGLYSALTKINGVSYNAINANGSRHVHIKSLVLSSKGSTFYSSGADGRIMKGDYVSLISSPTGFNNPYPSKSIAISRDENYLINGSDSSFIQIYSLNKDSERPSSVVNTLGGATNAIEFLPNNSGFVVASADKSISLIDPANGSIKKLVTLPYEIKKLDISPDGKFLAGATWTGQLLLIDLVSQNVTTLLDDGSIRISAVKFNPEGNMLAYGLEDRTTKRGIVKLLNLETQETRQFSGHKAAVNDVEFSPDGKLLASAGSDKRLLMWILDNPEDLPITMENNNGFIWDIVFTKNSDYLIAACSESEIRVWPTDPSLLAKQICPKLTRNMTQDEWKKYVGVGENVSYESTCTNVLIKDY